MRNCKARIQAEKSRGETSKPWTSYRNQEDERCLAPCINTEAPVKTSVNIIRTMVTLMRLPCGAAAWESSLQSLLESNIHLSGPRL